MRAIAARLCVAAGLWLLACGAAAAERVEKRYFLPGQGAFVLSLPAGWMDELRPNGSRPPTIFLSTAKGREPQLKLVPVWRARPDIPPFSRQAVAAALAKEALLVREKALEKEIRLVEFQGSAGAGWYFDVTDKAPAPGEYKYLRRGSLIVGELLLDFAILSNGRDEPVMREAMRILGDAAHLPKK
ncbi:MAG: hypothetical protein AB1452_08040 [Pseudomonadota bacterium]